MFNASSLIPSGIRRFAFWLRDIPGVQRLADPAIPIVEEAIGQIGAMICAVELH